VPLSELNECGVTLHRRAAQCQRSFLLGQVQWIVNLDAKIANGALKIGMAEQELASCQFTRNQHDLRAKQIMRAVKRRIQADKVNPIIKKTAVLTRC